MTTPLQPSGSSSAVTPPPAGTQGSTAVTSTAASAGAVASFALAASPISRAAMGKSNPSSAFRALHSTTATSTNPFASAAAAAAAAPSSTSRLTIAVSNLKSLKALLIDIEPTTREKEWEVWENLITRLGNSLDAPFLATPKHEPLPEAAELEKIKVLCEAIQKLTEGNDLFSTLLSPKSCGRFLNVVTLYKLLPPPGEVAALDVSLSPLEIAHGQVRAYVFSEFFEGRVTEEDLKSSLLFSKSILNSAYTRLTGLACMPLQFPSLESTLPLVFLLDVFKQNAKVPVSASTSSSSASGSAAGSTHKVEGVSKEQQSSSSAMASAAARAAAQSPTSALAYNPDESSSGSGARASEEVQGIVYPQPMLFSGGSSALVLASLQRSSSAPPPTSNTKK